MNELTTILICMVSAGTPIIYALLGDLIGQRTGITSLSIKTASTDTPIKALSGGNQQKVILARWLLANPVYMILDEPTRGIDVGTKVEIQKLVLQLAAEGKSVTFISSEIDEMLRVCSRLVVMRDRQVVGELRGSDLNQSSIMKTIAGGEQA